MKLSAVSVLAMWASLSGAAWADQARCPEAAEWDGAQIPAYPSLQAVFEVLRPKAGAKTETEIFEGLCEEHSACGAGRAVSFIESFEQDQIYALIKKNKGYLLLALSSAVPVGEANSTVKNTQSLMVLHHSVEEYGRDLVCEDDSDPDSCRSATVLSFHTQSEWVVDVAAGRLAWKVSCTTDEARGKSTALTLDGRFATYTDCAGKRLRFEPKACGSPKGIRDREKASVKRGRLLVRQGKDLEAIELFRQATEINPTAHRLWSELAFAQMKMKLWVPAKENFRKALRLAPADAGKFRSAVLYNLGTIVAQQKKPGEAQIFFEEALKANPKNKGALRKLAR